MDNDNDTMRSDIEKCNLDQECPKDQKCIFGVCKYGPGPPEVPPSKCGNGPPCKHGWCKNGKCTVSKSFIARASRMDDDNIECHKSKDCGQGSCLNSKCLHAWIVPDSKTAIGVLVGDSGSRLCV
ncbi:hypothetical protein EYZ11_010449 [Aspergillus tanneri]|uniref:Uncharacterized protein n=1 Tax=Aspergillus tanneri TaxID=1220188 RepID=A0A4S3J5M0_9EURO|nr:hypothetical protein EYZ11_010449 [Aspergillus tanneri]